MDVTLTYYGKLVEVVGKSQELIDVQAITFRELVLWLENEYPDLKKLSFKIAQNNAIGELEDKITSKNIDIFPPFSGG
ncbi:MoaD/ThiS family protein [Flavobacteriaceae bacterium]|nr:MoaD/ThiS family protein [Flavobacteriaceae bacterium]